MAGPAKIHCQDDQAERYHPESQDREEAEHAAENQKYSSGDADDSRPFLDRIDLGFEIGFHCNGFYAGERGRKSIRQRAITNMTIEFTKMQGLGNDFVIIDAVRQSITLSREQVRLMADRHLGIGCDQLLVAEPSGDPDFDFRFRIYNADGGEVGQCGNGARAFARFVRDKGLTDKTDIRVLTSAGPMTLHVAPDGLVSVNMGVPAFEPAGIPFQAPTRRPTYTLEVDGEPVEISALAIGNPHAVQEVSNVDDAPVARQGPLIESHPRFPLRVNAGYMQFVDASRIRLRVYERGAGETLACGSGACAAAVAGIQLGKLDNRVQVQVQGGLLSVNWQGEGHPVWLSGPATTVFEGRINPE